MHVPPPPPDVIVCEMHPPAATQVSALISRLQGCKLMAQRDEFAAGPMCDDIHTIAHARSFFFSLSLSKYSMNYGDALGKGPPTLNAARSQAALTSASSRLHGRVAIS